jgi:hypothetical protein
MRSASGGTMAEAIYLLFGIRLVAFVLIIVAVVEKNRSKRPSG